MKIASWNVNGIRSVVAKGFTEWLEAESPDIVCIQEAKLPAGIKPQDVSFGGYETVLNPATRPGYAGTMVLAKTDLEVVLTPIPHMQFIDEGRAILVRAGDADILNVYMPHGSRDKSKLGYKLDAYKALASYLEAATRPTVVVGDLNIAHTAHDLARPVGNRKNIMFTTEEREALDSIIELGYVDAFRELHPSDKSYTWWPYAFNCRERNIGWRIDYVLVSNGLMNKVSDVLILKEVLGSDHCPVTLQLKG